MKTAFLAVALILTAGAAGAQALDEFTIFDAEIMSLNQRIEADSMSTTIRPELLQELQGKQQELANQEAKLKKQAAALTPDEKSSLALSISEQQKRVARVTQTSLPQHRPDPASQVPPTYVTPNGMTISGPNPGLNPSGQDNVEPAPVPATPAQ